MIEKLGKDIKAVDGQFAELQPKLILEKENVKKMQKEKDKVIRKPEVPNIVIIKILSIKPINKAN